MPHAWWASLRGSQSITKLTYQIYYKFACKNLHLDGHLIFVVVADTLTLIKALYLSIIYNSAYFMSNLYSYTPYFCHRKDTYVCTKPYQSQAICKLSTHSVTHAYFRALRLNQYAVGLDVHYAASLTAMEASLRYIASSAPCSPSKVVGFDTLMQFRV